MGIATTRVHTRILTASLVRAGIVHLSLDLAVILLRRKFWLYQGCRLFLSALVFPGRHILLATGTCMPPKKACGVASCWS